MFHYLMSFVGFVLIAYLFVCLYMYFFQEKFVFFPSKEVLAIPSDFGLEYEEIFYESADGLELNAWYLPCSEPRGTVYFLHGNAGNMGDRIQTAKKWLSFGFHVFMIDYRGYGRSEGKPTEEGVYQDAYRGWEYLRDVKKVKSEELVLFGRSLGGAIASQVAKKINPKVFILEASFTSAKRVGQEVYPFLPVEKVSRISFATQDNIRSVPFPILITHSVDDRVIPFHHAKENYQAIEGEKAFLEMKGSHADGFLETGERYEEGIQEFLKQYFEK